MFGSLSPVWTRLGLHAADNSDPANPTIIHAFLPREADGYHIEETWDTLGMRATRSDDTILDGAFVPDRYIARKIPALALRPVPAGAVRQLPATALGGVLRAGAARGGPGDRVGEQQDVAGSDALDGLPPGGPAPGGRDGARARGDGRAHRAGRRRTGRTGSTTARPGASSYSRSSTTAPSPPSAWWTWR